MLPVTPSHTTWTNSSNSNAGSALSSQIASNENPVSHNGFHGAPNSGNHLAYVTGQALRTAYDYLRRLARSVGEADAALQFPVAEAASAPFFQPDGNMLRTRDMPESLERHQEIIRLKNERRKPDLSTSFHKEFAEQLKKTVEEMFKESPVIIVSDQEHSWGRSLLLREHLMLAASKEDFVVLMDGTVKGKEKERIQQVFQENYPAGLYLGLEADLSHALTILMFGHHEFFRLQSLPASDLDQEPIRVSFSKLLSIFGDSEAFKKEYSKLLDSAPPAERVPLVPFLNALYDSHQKNAQNMSGELAKWYVQANVKERTAVTLLLNRMMSKLAKSLNKEDARHVSSYLDDPKKNFDDLQQTLALTVRHRTWKEEIEAAYKKHGGKIPIVIFEGWRHDDYITKMVHDLTKEAKKRKPEMKEEL